MPMSAHGAFRLFVRAQPLSRIWRSFALYEMVLAGDYAPQHVIILR